MRGWNLSGPLGEPGGASVVAALPLDELIPRLGGGLLHGRVPHEADPRARRPFIGHSPRRVHQPARACISFWRASSTRLMATLGRYILALLQKANRGYHTGERNV